MEDFVGNTKLIPAKRLRELSQKSDLEGWKQTLSHFGVLAISTAALAASWGSLWAIPCFVIQGILINFLYAGQHELSHWTVFKTKKLNDIVGHMIGFILLLPRRSDRFEHFQHHRYTQDIELDGELDGAPPFTFWSYTIYFLGFTYWSDVIGKLIRTPFHRFTEAYLTDNQKQQIMTEARWYWLGYFTIALLSVIFQSWAAVTLWLAPMLVMKFIHQCQNITEHTAMPHEQDILINTRTIKSNSVLNWLAWNMPYHTAHHTYPSVPFFRLPQLHAEMVAAMGHEPETIGYLAFQKHMFRKLLKEGQSRYSGAPIHTY